MTVSSLINLWRNNPEITSNISEWRTIPARDAQYVTFPADLHTTLAESLRSRGITQLYTHQAAAWQHVKKGENPVIVTGTASGKTLCYNLPVLDALIRETQARALYLFPTKALAQDQFSVLQSLLSAIHNPPSDFVSPQVAIYDGDTPANHRPAIRENARLVLSNPDMLHTGILPHHTAWAAFFRGIRYVVIDEMHMYRGVFGSHVANAIRRLKRIATFYGSDPQFILTSATIGNPDELAERLIEKPVFVIDQDGSARGAKHFLIYNPPFLDQTLGIRRSSIHECVRLAEDLIYHGVQSVVFGRSRRSVEIILTYLREKTAGSQPKIQYLESRNNDLIRGYRSGYLPEKRREIEQGLRKGDVRLVVATNALELGIDVGGMDASVITGYPGTIAATWQQAGRSGRGEYESLSIFIASANPLDQFLARNPGYFFGRSPEYGLINSDNLLILLSHLRCAAFELPFQVGASFGNLDASMVQELLNYLCQEGVLHCSRGKYFWMADKYPAQDVSLRSASSDTVALQLLPDQEDAGLLSRQETIGEVDFQSAMWMVHPGAIYLHEAQTYFVSGLDLEQRMAQLKPVATDYYTEARRDTLIQLIEKHAELKVQGGNKAHGEIKVTSMLVGYRKVRWYTHETLGFSELSLPPSELITNGYWLSLDDATIQGLQAEGMWMNVVNDYGSDWPALRDRIRARDGFRCQACGIPEQDRSHDVHHKIPFKLFDSVEHANQPSNLVTLCHACHRRAEMAVRVRSGLAGLAYVLSNLAPLFLMCDSRDLGVQFDPQAEIADSNPAVIIYEVIPAGIGFSERLYEIHSEMIGRGRQLVTQCGCLDGCPSCVGPGGESGSGGKQETLALFNLLVDR